MTTFIEQYTASTAATTPRGIPYLTLHAPIVHPNGLSDIGLELEIEGKGLPSSAQLPYKAPLSSARWDTKVDGSLRGEAVEYVLSNPCAVDEVEELIKTLWNGFKSCNSKLTLSNRCSTHVHINMSGKKINELTSIVTLWTTFEDILINWCGEQRTTNHFCLASKDTHSLIDAWNRILSTGELNTPDGMKYSALNIRTLNTFGSFEFRCMRADTDPNVIIDWVKFVHALTKYACETFYDPSTLANAMSERGGEEIFRDICLKAGTSFEFLDSVLNHPLNANFNRKAIVGFRRSQRLTLGYPWYTWMDLINKEYNPKAKNTKYPAAWVEPVEEEDEVEFIGFEEFRQPLPGRRALPRPVDWDRPLMFEDGTPAVLMETREIGRGRNVYKVRAIVPHSRSGELDEYRGLDSLNGWWYKENGKWDGQRNVWVRNA